ncbi:MAG: helix-turn-helix transcriptional regulator [Coriobacteriia bacterium]|nr:helix-turn-helix transcriptional regulator [Coriobacteriia bacterium]MBS5478502.1 helix-turn-helix transcriptional regulator [Coriobacteriia bacterium]
MTTFRDYLDENLNDPAFRAEWEEQAPERAVMREIAFERERAGLTQKELAERIGMRQGNLSRLENGNGNPSIDTLAKIARGLGKRLEIRLV